MVDLPKRSYSQTPNKIRVLWEQANRLIAKHEELSDKMNLLEDKLDALQKSLNYTIEGTQDV